MCQSERPLGKSALTYLCSFDERKTLFHDLKKLWLISDRVQIPFIRLYESISNGAEDTFLKHKPADSFVIVETK